MAGDWLDEYFPQTGPCGVCGVPDAQQRAEALAAELNGETPGLFDPSTQQIVDEHTRILRALYGERDALTARVTELEADLAQMKGARDRTWAMHVDSKARAEEAERKLAETEREAQKEIDLLREEIAIADRRPESPPQVDGDEAQLTQAEVDAIHEAELRSYGLTEAEGVSAGDASPTGAPSTEPAEPLFTGTWLGMVQSSGATEIEAVIQVDEEPRYSKQKVDVYPAGSHPEVPKLTAEDVGRACMGNTYQGTADVLNAILAAKAGA